MGSATLTLSTFLAAAPLRGSIHAEPQREVIRLLVQRGAAELASRLSRCADAHQGRSRRDRWPWMCGSIACSRCGPRIFRRWAAGLHHWIADHALRDGRHGHTSTILLPSALLGATCPLNCAHTLRRRLRDLRDRQARRDARWARACFASIVGDAAEITIMVAHPALPHEALASVFRDRWHTSVIHNGLPPLGTFTWPPAPEVLVHLGMRRRGIEPLRVILPPRRITIQHEVDSAVLRPDGRDEPMPFVI